MKTFHPVKSIIVQAEKRPNIQYKVSRGFDDNLEGSPLVKKVQIIMNGELRGGVVPSYPTGTKDLENVNEAMEKLDTMDGEVEEKAFRSAIIVMARNMGYNIDMKQMYDIANRIANNGNLYELIEETIKDYFTEGKEEE
jgi:hypothetical protein